MGDTNNAMASAGDDESSEKLLLSMLRSSKFRTPYIYEGTDSGDDDDEVLLRKKVTRRQSSSRRCSGPDNGDPLKDFKKYLLQQGELATEHEYFVPWQAIKKYPFNYVGNANRQLVANNFFDQGQIYQNIWDFFYLYRLPQDINQTPILLVPTKQFECLLKAINQELGIHLRIPSWASNSCGFRVTFPNEGAPQPRYLGRATDRDAAEKLHAYIPPRNFRLAGEPKSIEDPSQQSLAAFKTTIDSMVKAHKPKKKAQAEKKQTQRVAQQEVWNQSIKKVQRYLGIRHLSLAQQGEIVRARLQYDNLDWMHYDEAFRDAMSNLPPLIEFDAGKPAPYNHGDSIVFVCVDVEAYERNTRQITEIGIATLDTDDLKAVNPGEGGVNWRKMIRARHFRVKENKHLINKDFVHGCADRFEFGKSEFVGLKDVPHAVSTCFKHPFSKEDAEPCADDSQKRNIVLVGHDVQADVKFLRTVGYDVYTLSNLVDTADTSLMWRYLKEENNPRNLAAILAELGIEAWHLHNGGNDAVYTLQAMIGIVIKSLAEEQEKRRKEEEIQRCFQRNEESIRASGWGPADEDDGGAPLSPVLPAKAAQVAVGQALVVEYLENLHLPDNSRWGSTPQPTLDPKV